MHTEASPQGISTDLNLPAKSMMHKLKIASSSETRGRQWHFGKKERSDKWNQSSLYDGNGISFNTVFGGNLKNCLNLN
jgi:hypothetical protein